MFINHLYISQQNTDLTGLVL